jgi:amidohydrolase
MSISAHIPEHIQELAQQYADDTAAIRRHLHQYPELSLEEHETAKFICGRLDDYHIHYRSAVAGNGVIAEIQGQAETAAGSERVTALRADIDALPIQEPEGLEFCSQRPGVMHACGHDIHSAALLGAGRILQTLRKHFSGTVRLLFQPSEERIPGGALGMIQAGALSRPPVGSVIGQHVNPDLPVGNVAFHSGFFMASVDDIFITVRGRGGHAAKPHQNIDPVIITAQLLSGLQHVVSRSADPLTPSVLSFGRVIADGAHNVIPNEVQIEGTFRTTDDIWRYEAHEQIRRISGAIAGSMGGSVDVDIRVGYPTVINEPSLTERLRSSAVEYLGPDRVVDIPPAMWAEDFAYYGREAPACFYNLGVGTPGKDNAPVHSPSFRAEESCIAPAAGLLSYLALTELS